MLAGKNLTVMCKINIKNDGFYTGKYSNMTEIVHVKDDKYWI